MPPFPSKQGLDVGAGFLLHARRIFGRLVDAWFGSGYLGMRDEGCMIMPKRLVHSVQF